MTMLDNKYYIKRILKLQDCSIENVEDSESLQNAFLILNPDCSYKVFASTPLEKQDWMEAIQKAISSVGGNKADIKNAAIFIMDNETDVCMTCQIKFSVTRRRHHCRNCGKVVCADCSQNREYIKKINSSEKVRVCTECFTELNENTSEAEKKIQQDIEKVRKIQKSFVGRVNLIAPDRKYIREGMLVKLCRKEEKTYYFFLFNDCLVYAQPLAAKKYIYHRAIDLNEATVKDIPDTNILKNAFQVVSTEK